MSGVPCSTSSDAEALADADGSAAAELLGASLGLALLLLLLLPPPQAANTLTINKLTNVVANFLLRMLYPPKIGLHRKV
jgi:hypothetical protein